jgi:hypothetical protein
LLLIGGALAPIAGGVGTPGAMWARVMIVGATLAGAAVLSTQLADAARMAPACGERQLSLVTPQTQGTASQEVVFVGLRSSGAACRLTATALLTVEQDGSRVASFLGNPLRDRIVGTFARGRTWLFDAWWSNWCGDRRTFRARAAMGAHAATGPDRKPPPCLSAGSPSRLKGVRQGMSMPPVAGP